MRKERKIFISIVLCLMVITFFTPQAASALLGGKSPEPLPPKTLSALSASTGVAASQTVNASVSPCNVTINGKTVVFEAYIIKSSNYYKLRDIAFAISGTAKQFDVAWDGVQKAITISKGQKYTPVGGEMAVSDVASTDSPASELTRILAKPLTGNVYCDGALISITAYTVGGNNYFKLRDLATLVGFIVNYDSNTMTVNIDTTQG